MKVKTDSGCCLIEYDIYISRKVDIKKGNRVYIYTRLTLFARCHFEY